MNSRRGKGRQKVTVKHVHVHSGGRAIVGSVEHPGGGTSKSPEQDHAHAAEEQDHAQAAIAHAQEPEMRGSLAPERETMSERGNG
jgi:hypothetical protein